MIEPVLLVHGGAGDIPDSRVEPKKQGCRLAASAGYKVLTGGGSALDAVVAAVKSMEDDPVFNAGKGSVLNEDGDVEMDAMVMEGRDLRCGAVGALKQVQHPIDVARLVMEKTPHVLLVGDGAKRFANAQGVPDIPPEQLVTELAKGALAFKKSQGSRVLGESELMSAAAGGEGGNGGVGTVGAVAVDAQGHVAVATSTGGTTGKMAGRVGDSPLPGCGTYCDDKSGAVSATGHGESIMRVNLARHILSLIEEGFPAAAATKMACEAMTARVGNTGGAVTVSSSGQVGYFFTSNRMAWAYQQAGKMHFGVDKGEHVVIDIDA